ncbi:MULTISPECIES: NAD-dependent epimerase/dehydratase family protein [unclassified Pseudoalteromonas]|uniref:NAD-dependent epimerase/dehydratase family protein n=1 Tax=unclassified Pseudoalteromonas TaxID=194690 RepID=UPI0025B398FD|nr:MULTISPECIES: NAD-dependent epimerase/dehydratase family protein [unclassified Pseudoalteromonas]MDN3379402.1 NADP-binding protein [Pseudoalteromonas sp. APC 3893]MDN3386576.1 NADP-binding protein [Pseudoalteromonas sp. APC 4017]
MGIFERKLVVLGAGWLGQALCLNRLQQNWQVQGTHRSAEHQEEFLRQFVLQNEQLIHQLDLENAWWVCAMPPRSRQPESNYQATLERSLKLAKAMNAQGFLLCSSTGVYDPSANIYDEASDITASGERQQRLIDAEQSVLNAGGKVLRLAGLVGPGREPGRFVAGKQLNSSSQQVVNMVHQQDVINAIVTVLEQWQTAAPIYNVVNPAHPSKADYYKQKCAQYGTPAPTFTSDVKAERIINGSAIESLGFNYQFDI